MSVSPTCVTIATLQIRTSHRALTNQSGTPATSAAPSGIAMVMSASTAEGA